MTTPTQPSDEQQDRELAEKICAECYGNFQDGKHGNVLSIFRTSVCKELITTARAKDRERIRELEKQIEELVEARDRK